MKVIGVGKNDYAASTRATNLRYRNTTTKSFVLSRETRHQVILESVISLIKCL